MVESGGWVSNIKISILLKKCWFPYVKVPWNEKNNTFTWLSSFYNPFTVFIGIVNELKLKPNKLQVDQGREFYNKLTQKWLDDNYSLMYLTQKDKSLFAERFIRTFKGQIYKQITANDIKSYLGYFNKLVDEYRNTYNHSIGKKPIFILIILLCLKNLNQDIKLLNLKLMKESGLLSIKIILANVTLCGQKKHLRLILCWKLILGHIILKI